MIRHGSFKPSAQHLHFMCLDVKRFIDESEASPHFHPPYMADATRRHLQQSALRILVSSAQETVEY